MTSIMVGMTDSEILAQLGARLRAYRLQQNLTVAHVARRAVPGGDDDPARVTVTLTDIGERTRMVEVTAVSSRAVRDAIVKTGMEAGLQDALDLLEEVARSLQ